MIIGSIDAVSDPGYDMAKKNGVKNGIGEALHDLFKEVFALQTMLSRVMDKVHEQAGLSTSQRRVIQLLNRMGAATVPDMAFELGVSRQSVQVICNDLFSRNLIEFKENPRHKRSKLVILTEPGLHALQRAQQKEYQVIEQLFQRIEIEKVTQTYGVLVWIRKTMENLEDGGHLMSNGE
jgi:DNA-binding MarR family transcriptional regulator